MKSRESRLTRLETLEDALDPETAWERTAGLCALLQARALLPPRAPLDEAALEADDTGMGRLLREARQWQQERGA